MPGLVKRSSVRLNFFEDEEFDFQLLRAIGAEYHGGAALGECLATASRIHEGDILSWVEEWSRTAQLVEATARDFLRNGEIIGARESYQRAAMYYRSAEYYGFFSEPGRYKNWMKSRDCIQKAGKLLDTPLEVIEIPFEDINLRGYFLQGNGSSIKKPTLILMTGFDGTAEELYFLGLGVAERGYNALIVEGPGQAGMIHLYPDHPFRPDYEKPVTAVVDYTLSRGDVDEEKLAILGLSLGGYFVSRAVVYEKRIKACIADSPIINIHDYFEGFSQLKSLQEIKETDYPLVFEAYPVVKWVLETFGRRFAVDNIDELYEKLKEYDISDKLQEIHCPTLTLIGKGEGEEAVYQAKKFYNEVSGLKEIHIFTEERGADAHCQVANTGLMVAIIIFWLNNVFKISDSEK